MEIRHIFARKFLLRYLLILLIIAYVVLAWLQQVPSIFHVEIIRKIWDKKFAECLCHAGEERDLSPEERHPIYLTVKLSGRLGNWLFAYASLMGIADKNNVQFFVDPYADSRVNLASIFKVKRVKAINAECLQPIYEDKPCAYNKKFELLPFNNLTIHGYLQSWKYFYHIEQKLREEFVFQNHILRNAREVFQRYVKPDKTLTSCVHVRRTDMKSFGAKKIGFKVAPVEYLLNAMNHIRHKFNQPIKFIVISDDVKWCFKNLNFSDTITLPPNRPEVDLALISMCNSTILTTGTFGWWGAWLSNGYTVYYKNYPEPGTRLDRDTVKEDFFPPHWVPVDGAVVNTCTSCVALIFCLLTLVLR